MEQENYTNKKERFKRLATKRTNSILKRLEVLGNCANRGAYDYTEEEIKALIDLDARASQALNVAAAQAEKENRQNILARTISLVIGAIFLIVMALVILVAAGRIG